MRIHNLVPCEHVIRPGIVINAVSVGSKGPGQSLFLVPMRSKEDEVDDTLWGLLPTSSGKPQIVANIDPKPGVLLRLSTYNRAGKRIGRLFLRSDCLDNVVCVGFGIAGDELGELLWEEAIFAVSGSACFFLLNVGPPNELVFVEDGEVTRLPAEQGDLDDAEYVRVDDPNVLRWISEEHHAQRKTEESEHDPNS
jgi:hypothetical protein